ncbi:hypothetical protein B0H11DRAFT_2260711 [Mycena galericulata]|nr:hypothetical protein B0H11DRAFT_2260711 [Mycena galericulata]
MHRTYTPPQRFQPFRRRTPLVPTPVAGWLSDAYQHLNLINRDNGKLCTWDHGITNSWVEIPRPQRVTSKGPVDLAATGFKKVWSKNNSPFFCPHTKANGQPYKPLVLRLGGLLDGGVADYFVAPDHACAFKVVVKPLKESNYLLSWEDQDRYQQENEEEYNEEDSIQRSSSPIGSFPPSSPPSSQSSIASASSVSSTSSSISRLAVEAMLAPDPRYGRTSRASLQGSRPNPTPIAAGTSLQSPPDARKTADFDTLEYIHQIDSSGVLAEDPSVHPAWDTDQPHPLLRVYDKRIYPHCLARTHHHLNFLYKPVGQAIRELNSPLGIPYHDYATMIHMSRSCNSCKAQFSPDGYTAHVQDGICTNHPDLKQVAECEPSEAAFQFRSFRDGQRPENVQESLDTPVGAALLEWNSRVGVPTDVWVLVCTAIVLCDQCDLVRSFPSHLRHLNKDGLCSDPGQSVTIGGGDDA